MNKQISSPIPNRFVDLGVTPSSTQPDTRTVLPERNLDILRALAVVCVFIDHLTGMTPFGTDFTRWLGQAGVLSFFVHTSLVLMSSLERDGAPNESGWVWRFYLRRALRIYPLAWAIIALVLLLHIPRGSLATRWEAVPLSQALANFALVQNLALQETVLAPLWTLPLELQMYVALAFCFLVARRPSRLGMSALVATGVFLAGFFEWGTMKAHRVPGLPRLNVFVYVPCFLMGVSAYWALRRRKGAARVLPACVWLPIILADIGVASLAWSAGQHWLDRVIFSAVLGLAIPFVREAAPSMLTRVAHTVALYSYGIYLIHVLALRVGFGVLQGRPWPVQLVTVFAVLGAGSYAGYHLIEKPGIALGRRLLGGRRGTVSLEATAPPP